MNDRYLLTTPENVPISYELAGVGSRFVAMMLDTLILTAVEIGLFVGALILARFAAVTQFLSQFEGNAWQLALALLVLFFSATVVGYPLLFEIIWNGQTPGKRLTGIRVVQDDGGPLTTSAAIIRNVLRVVDSLPVYYIIGVTVMLLDRKSRRLGDIAAGTICVKERKDMAVEHLATYAPAERAGDEPSVPAFANLQRLSNDDAYLVKEFLARRTTLAPAAAQQLAEQIAGRIALKLAVERGYEPAEDFLARVSAALQSMPRR